MHLQGGKGISHIIAKRNWEGQYIKVLLGQRRLDVVKNVIQALCSMTLPQHVHKYVDHIVLYPQIEYKEHKMILERAKEQYGNVNEPRWLITGFELVDDDKYNLVIDEKIYESVDATVASEPQNATLCYGYSPPPITRLLQGEGASTTQKGIIIKLARLALLSYAQGSLGRKHLWERLTR